MTAQGPDLRALADTLRRERDEYEGNPNSLLSVARANLGYLAWDNLPTIISALERAAAAEGEKAEARQAGRDEVLAVVDSGKQFRHCGFDHWDFELCPHEVSDWVKLPASALDPYRSAS